VPQVTPEAPPVGYEPVVEPDDAGDPIEVERAVPAWRRALALAVVAARPAGIYLAARLVVLVAIWTASRVNAPVSVGSAVTGWDGGWYLEVSTKGYPHSVPAAAPDISDQSRIAFFPLYPLCIRFVSGTFGVTPRVAGLAVAGAAGILAAVLLWFLLRRIWDDETADRGVALFCFFPGALVLSMTYAEPLMLALTVGCLLALLSRWWVTAGVLAALATATRPNALALVAACAWAAGVAVVRRREWRALIAPLLAPVGFVAFQLFLWRRTGALDAWFQVQRNGWDERIAFDGTWRKFDRFFEHPFGDVNITVAVFGTVFLLATLYPFLRARLPGPVVAYTLGIVLLALGSETLGARPRFVLTAFPLIVVLARYLRGSAFSVTLACSATVLGSFAVMSLASYLVTP
jgi:hypothetical protein